MEKQPKEGKRLYPKETIEAFDKSIEKWFNVTFKGAVDHGGSDCALCDLFARNMKCEGCPISDKVGVGGCRNTPHTNWFNEIDSSKVVDSNSAEKAYNFYKWLVELRKRIGVEEERKKFTPFTLTITTLEGAQELWHRLNVSLVTLEDSDYNPKNIRGVPFPTVDHLYSQWNAVDTAISNYGK